MKNVNYETATVAHMQPAAYNAVLRICMVTCYNSAAYLAAPDVCNECK